MYSADFHPDGFLLGPRYALIRDEFKALSEFHRSIADVPDSALVTLGGNPQVSLLESVVKTVAAELSHVDVFPGQISQADRARFSRVPGVEVFPFDASPAHSMMTSDVAISAAGSTSLELLFFGLPSILLDVAPNQTPNADWLAEHHVAIHIPDYEASRSDVLSDALGEFTTDRATRDRMSEEASSLVDGHGADRVVQAMNRIASLHNL